MDVLNSMFSRRRHQQAPEHRFWLELITAESDASRYVRYRRLIRFPQLTMPLLAALTPSHWKVTHTDEIVPKVRFELAEEVLQHADAVVVDEAEPVWDSLLADFERGELKAHYESKDFPGLAPDSDLFVRVEEGSQLQH